MLKPDDGLLVAVDLVPCPEGALWGEVAELLAPPRARDVVTLADLGSAPHL